MDGRHLSKGVDLLDLIEQYNNDPERVFNLIDTVVGDLMIEDAENEARKDARDRLKYLRKTGTIDSNNERWSNDESYRQPDRSQYPTPITPTEDGYPGLEPPIG